MNARTTRLVHWLRKMHGWIGLWGAILGLIAGTSGVWLNHRAVLKLDLPGQRQANGQVSLPEPPPATPEAMAVWLQGALKLDRPANSMRVERGQPLAWGARGDDQKPLVQPARWTFNFGGPNRVIQAEYWQGNRSVSVRTTENGFVATLTNLHKGVAMPVPWILLIDTLAGSIVFLSLSGVVLWWFTNRRRVVGMAILGTSVALTAGLALWSAQ